MKKVLITLLITLISLSFIWSVNAADCRYNFDVENANIWDALDNCLEWVKLVTAKWEMKIEGKFWNQIKSWTNNIALYLWVFAVWSIVFGGLMMTISVWEEEKIKKAKDIVKWWIIWFLWIIFASAIINLVVKIMYSI